MDRTQIQKSRATGENFKKSLYRMSFKISVALAFALLGFMPLSLWWTVRSGGATMVADYSAKLTVASKIEPASPNTSKHNSKFFGFLEFDWDPNAPGGIPGFDPWPQSSN